MYRQFIAHCGHQGLLPQQLGHTKYVHAPVSAVQSQLNYTEDSVYGFHLLNPCNTIAKVSNTPDATTLTLAITMILVIIALA